jgi:hypothetical protein
LIRLHSGFDVFCSRCLYEEEGHFTFFEPKILQGLHQKVIRQIIVRTTKSKGKIAQVSEEDLESTLCVSNITDQKTYVLLTILLCSFMKLTLKGLNPVIIEAQEKHCLFNKIQRAVHETIEIQGKQCMC